MKVTDNREISLPATGSPGSSKNEEGIFSFFLPIVYPVFVFFALSSLVVTAVSFFKIGLTTSLSILLTGACLFLTSLLVYPSLLKGRTLLGDIREAFRKPLKSLRTFLAYLLIGLTLPVITSTIVSKLAPLISPWERGEGPVTSDTTAGLTETLTLAPSLTLVLTFLATVLVAPVAEEIFFRKLFLSRLLEGRRSLSKVVYYVLSTLVVLISTTLFSLAHFQGLDSFADITVLLSTFLSGLVFSLVYLYKRNLLAAIGLHSGNNLMVFIAVFLM